MPGFSGRADDAAASELLPEHVGRVGADSELRGLPNDKLGSDVGRGVAVDGGAEEGAVLLVDWPPNEKLVLLLPKNRPPKLNSPEEPALVSGRLPKTPVEELLGLGLGLAATVGAAAEVAVELVSGGSAGFPSTAGLGKLNPEGAAGVLVGCAPAMVTPGDGALLAGLVDSSAWPTRSPEKLPRVSPVRELGNSSSPSLDGGASSLPAGVEREIPEGAAGLLLDGADSPGAAPAAPVLADVTVPEEGKLSGTVS